MLLIWNYTLFKVWDKFIVIHDKLIQNIIHETFAFDTNDNTINITIDNTVYDITCNIICNASTYCNVYEPINCSMTTSIDMIMNVAY